MLVPNGAAMSTPVPDYFRGTNPDGLLSFTESIFANRLYVVRAALRPMIEPGGGQVISIGADLGRWPTPGKAGPGSASAALMMATKVLAWELGRWDITVRRRPNLGHRGHPRSKVSPGGEPGSVGV